MTLDEYSRMYPQAQTEAATPAAVYEMKRERLQAALDQVEDLDKR